jgi:hypothetical protein
VKVSLELPSFKVIDLSTAHITKEDNEILLATVGAVAEAHPQVVLQHGFGYFVSTWHNGKDNPENFEEALLKLGHSPSYVNLVMLAHRAGAKWLCLDCDAEAIDGLPVYSW